MKKNSIQNKLLLLISIFSAILIISLWAFQFAGIDRLYSAYSKYMLKKTALYIEQCFDNNSLTDEIMSLYEKKGISIVVFDENGKTIAFNNSNLSRNYFDMIPLIQKAEEKNSSQFYFQSTSNELSIPQYNRKGDVFSLDDARIVEYKRMNMVYIFGESDPIVLFLSMVSEPGNETVFFLRGQLIITSIAIMFLALLIYLYSSKKITQPIVRISQNAKRIKYGEYNSLTNRKQFSEIKELDTTLKEASVDLSKTEQFRRELLGNVSHDLRTPLTLIQGYAELIHDFPDDDGITENAELIINEAKRLSRLVNDILEVTNNESDSSPLKMEEFELNSCIQDVLLRYSHIKDLDTTINYSKKNESVFVLADKDKISQVLYNLINNAIDYTNNNRIDIYQDIADNSVIVSVVDYGDGIKEDEIPRIWDRYYKVDTVHKRSRISTGIGLSIVKDILQKHSSKFGVKSTVGQGSCFWFELPVVKKDL